MAQRRMFSLKIVGSDAFLEMPTSSRELYWELGMYADDDGFVNPRKIMRMVGATDDDLKMLIVKRFVLPFENGVIVIKHWKINNLIRKDFYQETEYIEQKKTLFLKANGSYTDNKENGDPLLCQQNVNNSLTQDRIGKDSIGKERKEELSSLYKSGTREYVPFYRGEQMRWSDGKWWVLPKIGGEWCEFADKESEIDWVKK